MPMVAISIMSVKKVASDAGGFRKPFPFSPRCPEYGSAQSKQYKGTNVSTASMEAFQKNLLVDQASKGC